MFPQVLAAHNGSAEIIAEALAHNANLYELALASNGLSARSISALIAVTAKHPHLQRLDLGYSPSTRALNARGNELGENGAREIAPLLRENRTLRHLNLRGNRFEEAQQNLFCEALHANYALQVLAFDGPMFAPLKALLARNRATFEGHDEAPDDVKLIRSVYRTVTK